MIIETKDISKLEVNDYLKGIQSCICGENHATCLEDVLIKEGAIEELPKLLNKYGFKKALVISDSNTYEVAGRQVSETLFKNKIQFKELIFKSKDDLIPDEESVGNILIQLDESIDSIITVGTGTLNDLSKFVSYKMNIPSIIVATAPSMDGFVSNGAALIVGDLKISYKALVPKAVIGDINILKEAPIDMILAGFGDIVGKYSALNDWKISKLVNGEYYCDFSAEMVRNSLENCIQNAHKIKDRDPLVIKGLMEALVITGIAMSFVENSRPASGSEHHLAHYFEMKFLFENRNSILHGRKVGVMAVITARLRELLVHYDIDFEKSIKDATSFNIDEWREKINIIFKGAAEEVIEISERDETTSSSKKIKRIHKIEENINEIKNILIKSPTQEEIEIILKDVGAPYKLEQININKDEIVDAIYFAKEIRTRYTVLTLLSDLGLLHEFASDIEKDINI
ncbi:MAG: sn-glycerol-1-phosphate dehydrogenase [Clostridium sp.]|uniref:sn-glycerol-1-phosphate dehydrogenase n=1 Tax=Clostridium sp. TaxID=1506 RepID=UPI003F35DDB3